MQIVFQAQSHKGLVRQLNEDACLAMPEAGVWAVADGMGGHAAGDVASQLVMDMLKKTVTDAGAMVTPALLCQALQQANQALLHFSKQQLLGTMAGSTVVVLFIQHNNYHLLWAGDSRCYLLRHNQLTQLSHDHSQVNEMVEQGLLAASEAESHELANVITRAVGVDDVLDVAVNSDVCQPGDLFLLCTDGLTKELPDHEIHHYLQHEDIADASKALLHSTLVAGAKDNVTSILVKLHNSSYVNINDKTIPINLKIVQI
ncbi:serine/threonine protein phosphatase [Arsukibacterium sp. MJ3]|uniref:PP2C family protein-serine/threonine phosphatase n=1 Tax=Arsukibacterium sp. MJ3 TaxID=1632859 RepID=UPI000626F164|nr:protein phosphatase 2C domain-containing protein [Arsukibacterium sp. MJ3]KKO50698.1 serine/threonine protein phosphatase [Arsukibacterium sp. MJ3]